jgi:hypothetical protein
MASGLLGSVQAAPKSGMPSKPNAAGEQSGDWIDTQEGQEATAIMERALKGEIDNNEFVRLREAWRQKWVNGKGAETIPVPVVPNVKLRK